MSKTLGLGVLVLGLALGACGSNKKSSGASTDAGSKSDSGSVAATDSGTATETDAGKKDAGGLAFTCDTSVVPATTCGTETCMQTTGQLASRCQIACCTAENKCGTKNTATVTAGTSYATCQGAAVADPSCPSLNAMGFSATGCCLANGNCGVSFAGTPCIDPSSFGSNTGIDAGAPKKCGGSNNDGGTGDAG